MIFYFSATGNSLYAAKSILKDKEELVSIPEAVKEKKRSFDIKDDSIGFVFPVYYMGAPNIVAKFISGSDFKVKKGAYIYIVLTCGSITGSAGNCAKKLLKNKGIVTSSVFSVKMVDTYVPLFKIPPKAEQDKIMLAAKKEIENIACKIENRVSGDNNHHKGIFPGAATFFSYNFYKRRRFTSKFHAENSCIGCGMCEKICPENAIKVENGKPVWIKKQCSICLGCLHRCPKESIQYGRKTKNSGRFYLK